MKASVEPRNTWIFQANPSRYNIHVSLVVETAELWNCNQHADRIRRGDRALIWISGPEAGIYAVGTVTGNPVSQSDTPQGIDYWANPLEGVSKRPRAPVRYDRVLVEQPLLREYLRCDPALWNLTILKQPRGTNFAVSEEEWRAIEAWLNG